MTQKTPYFRKNTQHLSGNFGGETREVWGLEEGTGRRGSVVP